MSEKQKLLWRFAKSYMLILILPLIIGFYTYYRGVSMVEADTYSILHAMLTQTIQTVEQGLNEMETLSVQIANNPVLSEQSYQSGQSGETVLDMERCIREINKYFVTDTATSGCFVYFRNSDYVMTRETLYRTELYYSHVLQYRPELYEDWTDLMNRARVPGEFVNIDRFYSGPAGENPYIAYVTSVPFHVNAAQQASLVLLYNKEDIAAAFLADTDSSPAMHVVVDENGELITVTPQLDTGPLDLAAGTAVRGHSRIAGPDGDLIGVYQAGRNGWVYGYFRQESAVFQHLRSYRAVFLLVVSICTLAGIACLLLISYRNTKPVYQLVDRLREYGGDPSLAGENAYSIIEQGITKLIHSRDDLMTGLERQIPMVKAAFAKNLLRGLLYSEQDARAQAEHLQMTPGTTGGLFQVALFRLEAGESEDGRDRLYAARAALVKNIEEQLTDVYFIHHWDYATVAVALYCHSQRDTREQLEGFVGRNSAGIPLFVGVGEGYGQLSEIWYSFDQAQACVDAAAPERNSIMFYSDRPEYSEKSYYSIQVEQHLVNHIKGGEWESAGQLLDTLYNENYKKRLLSPAASKSLLAQLKGTMYRSVDNRTDPGLEEIVALIGPSVQPEQAFRHLKQACRYIASSGRGGKKRQADAVAQDIRSYIEENYMVSALSLSMAASHFHLSEGYFSLLFKENIGIPFTDYVESVRIQKSMILLRDTSLTVNEISLLCGYNSPQSFRRAFKRVTGQSPSHLRGE